MKHEIQYVTRKREAVDIDYHFISAEDGRPIFHGLKTAYWSKNVPSSILNYHAGDLHGVQRWFDRSGKLQTVMLFANGKTITSAEFEKQFGPLPLNKLEQSALQY